MTRAHTCCAVSDKPGRLHIFELAAEAGDLSDGGDIAIVPRPAHLRILKHAYYLRLQLQATRIDGSAELDLSLRSRVGVRNALQWSGAAVAAATTPSSFTSNAAHLALRLCLANRCLKQDEARLERADF